MQTGSYDYQISQNSLQIKQEDGFFSRLLSKEANSMANSSFRVYYGGASGAVPFRWETRPGTPKHTFSDTSIPPLTPPPSYFSSSKSNSHFKKSSSKSTLLSSIFPRLTPKKSHHSPSSFSLSSGSSSSSSLSSWSSSRSSSCLSPASNTTKPSFFKRRHFSDIPSLPFDYSFDNNDNDNDHHDDKTAVSTSPTSTLCFGTSSKASSNAFRGCYQFVSVKNALLSIVGRHGSAAQGTVN